MVETITSEKLTERLDEVVQLTNSIEQIKFTLLPFPSQIEDRSSASHQALACKSVF